MTYHENDLKVLSFLEGVRRRPAMYIGSVDRCGLLHLLATAVDPALDECRYGHATTIDVRYLKTGEIIVADDGDGVSPMLRGPKGLSYLEEMLRDPLVLRPIPGRIRSRNLYEMDYALVNALSRRCEVESVAAGKQTRLSFERGELCPPKAVTDSSLPSGFTIHFLPDPEIFREARFDLTAARNYMWEQAVLLPGVRIRFHDETAGTYEQFRCPDGVVEFLRRETEGKPALWPAPIRCQTQLGVHRLDVAVQFVNRHRQRYTAFANRQSCLAGGSHVAAAYAGIARALRRCAPLSMPAVNEWDDLHLLRGILLAIAVELQDAHYEGPTKERLSNPELDRWITNFVAMSLEEFFLTHYDYIRLWQAAHAEAENARP